MVFAYKHEIFSNIEQAKYSYEMILKSSIPKDQWYEKVREIGTNNIGRTVVITFSNSSKVQKNLFRWIESHHENGSEELVILLGENNQVFRYTIFNPKQIIQYLDSIDNVISLEIIRTTGESTFLHWH